MNDEDNIKKQPDVQTEKRLKESEEKYKTLTEIMIEGIFIMDFEGRVIYCNESAVKMFGYDRPEEGIGKNIFEFISPESREIVIEDMKRVYQGTWGFLAPYKVMNRHGNEFWVETLGRKITYEGKPAEVVVLRDVTERILMEEALKKAKDELEIKVEERTAELSQSLEKLQRLLDQTVVALVSAVEAKDPYTAGHQQEVAKFACAIAKEMGLSEEQIKGLYMAAIVHDVGKIHIPAEILTKPEHLTEDEMNMIKTHPRYGHDILNTIEFPWPIAKIVLQHHERMDGSGYPLGIRGKEILLEARILGVADVVEAISSTRPYRPALGIKKAVEEISQKKGILYDPTVVEACLEVINKDEFRPK